MGGNGRSEVLAACVASTPTEDRDSCEIEMKYFSETMDGAGWRQDRQPERRSLRRILLAGGGILDLCTTCIYTNKHKTLPPHCIALLVSCPRHTAD